MPINTLHEYPTNKRGVLVVPLEEFTTVAEIKAQYGIGLPEVLDSRMFVRVANDEAGMARQKQEQGSYSLNVWVIHNSHLDGFAEWFANQKEQQQQRSAANLAAEERNRLVTQASQDHLATRRRLQAEWKEADDVVGAVVQEAVDEYDEVMAHAQELKRRHKATYDEGMAEAQAAYDEGIA